MILDEAREALAGAAWTRRASLVALLNEVVGWHDTPTTNAAGNKQPGVITQAFAEYKRSHVSSGRVVQLLISLRLRYKMPPYTVKA